VIDDKPFDLRFSWAARDSNPEPTDRKQQTRPDPLRPVHAPYRARTPVRSTHPNPHKPARFWRLFGGRPDPPATGQGGLGQERQTCGGRPLHRYPDDVVHPSDLAARVAALEARVDELAADTPARPVRTPPAEQTAT